MASTDPIYKINNKEVPASAIKLAAEQNGITFEEYVTRRGAVLVPGKKTDSTITNPNVESENTGLDGENGSSELPKDNGGITFGEPMDYDFDNPEEAESSGRRFIQLKRGRIFEDTYLQEVKENPIDKYNQKKPDTFEKYVLANKWDPANIRVEGIKEPNKKTANSKVARKIMDDLKINFGNTEAQDQAYQAEADALFVPYADRPKTYVNTGGLYSSSVEVVESNEEYDTFVKEASKILNVKKGTGDNPFGSKEAEVLKLANKLYVTDKRRTEYADNLEAWARENDSSWEATSVGANLDYIKGVTKKAIKGITAEIEENKAKAQVMVDAMVLMKNERIALRTAAYNTNDEILAARARDKYLAENIVVANQKYQEYFQNNIQSLAYENAENEAILDIAKRSYKNTSIIGANIAATVGETIGGILNVPEWLVVSAESIVTGKSPEETATRMSGYLDLGGDVLLEAGQAFRNSVAKPIDVEDIDSWSDFAYWGTDMVSNQALNTVLMVAAPAASLGVMATSAAGGKYSDMMSSIENGEAQYTGWQMFAAPAIVGTLEYVTEKVSLGQLKGIKTVFKKNNSVQKAATEYINDRILNKNYFVDTLGEGLAEGINQLGGNATDIFLLDNKNVHIWDGVPNAAASGTFMSGVIYKAPVIGARMLSPFAKQDMKPRLFANMQMLNKIELELAKPDLSDSVKKSLKDSKAKIQQANTDIITEQLDNVDGLTDSQKTELIAIDKSKVQVQAEWAEINDDTSVSDAIKAELLETKNKEYNKLNGEKNAILAKAGADQDILKVQTLLNQVNGKSELKVFETNDKSTSDEQLKAFLIEQGKTEEYAEANKSNYGAFVPDINDPTKEYLVINKDSALEDKVVTTGQHEFLHKVLKQAFASNPELAKTMGSLLLKEINTNPDLSSPELRGRIAQYAELLANPNEDFNEADFFEEVLTTFSEALKNDEVTVNETIASKIGDIIRRAANSLGIRKIKFKTSKDVVNFIRDYNRDFSKAKLSKQLQKFSEGESISTKTAASLKSPKSVLNKINDLVPPSVKTQAEYFSPKVFNPIYNATLPNGVISNYIKSKSPSKEVGEKAIAGIQDRLVNYDPAAERKKAGNKEPITFGEFIFANTNFIKLDAKKALFKESEAAKKTTDLDTKEAQSKIAEDDAVKKDRPKFRKLIDSSVLPGFNIKEIGGKLTKVVKVLKSKLDAKVSINKSVSPLIAEIKKAMGKQADIDLKKAMGGKADAQLQKWLLKNKKAILENMTTTWLMGAIPEAIQKSVGGAYKVNENGTRIKDSYGDFIFVPNFTSDWQGKDIDREKTSTNKSGKTSGGDIVRRLPNVATALSDADFVGSVLQDVSVDADGNMTSGAPIRGKKESMAKAIAEEISLEIFNKELQDENSEISKAFENNQTARGVVLADNFVEDITRQSERGTVKFSIRKLQDMFYSSIEGDAAAVDGLYATLDEESKAIWEKVGTQLSGGSEGYKKGLKVWEDAPNAVKGVLADYFKNNSKRDNKIAMNQLDVFSNKLIDALPNSIVKAIGADFFGAHFRYLNTKPGTKGGAIKNKINNLKEDDIDLGFDTNDITIVQAGFGLVDKITKDVLNKEFNTVQDKIDYFNENYKDKVDALNVANKQAAQAVLVAAFDIIAKDPKQAVGFLRMLESTTNIGKSLRGLTGISDIQFYAESQAVYINTKTGATYTNNLQGKQKTLFEEGDIVINENHPNYKDAVKAIEDGSKQSLDQLLRIKGEHATPDAKKKLEIAKILLDHVAIAIENPTQVKLIKNAFAAKLNVELQNFNQQLNTKVLSDIQDSKLGATSDIGDARLAVIPKESLLAFYDIEGIQTAGRVKRAFNDMFTTEKTQKLASVETQQKAINNARSIKWSQSPKKIRVFDFDDTLARTKSNVLYTMPNAEGGFSEGATKLKAIFMVGGPGAGKTNVGKGLQLGRRGYKVVNQDIALEAMKTEAGLPANESDYTAEQRSMRSKLGSAARKAAVAKFDKYAANGDGMVIDGTGASYNATTKKIKALEDQGFEVHMVVAMTPLETALERNKARKERSLKDFIVEKTYNQVQESLAQYRKDFGDRLYEINTETIEYGKPLPKDFLDQVYAGITKTKVGKIDAATFAKDAGKMEAEGAQWDFSEFSKVMDGKPGPLLEVAKIIADKRGTKDVFVLTARPADAAGPIREFLSELGLDIPLENITGLGDGTPKAKADWIVGKVADGYNDFYFADDHTGNVKAVKDALDTFDVKGKVQLAKVKFSQKLDKEFNDMIERQKGVESFKEFSKATAQRRGKKTGKFKFFISPSAEDFRGLTQYKFAGKGKQGEADQKFFEESLMDPYFQGIAALESARQAIKEDTKALLKTFKPVRKKLSKLIKGEQYTYDAAVRVYLWNKAGEEVPGLSKRDNKKLNDLVANDPELSSFADGLLMVSKKDAWPAPSEYWMAQTTLSDLNNLTEKTNRKEYLAEFIENVDIIFSEKNLNKVEALYGEASRKAIENSIYAMKSGSNSPNQSGDAITSKWMNWVNSSIGTIMFFNRRSAVLQTLSAGNFINWSDNNPVKAAIAFANQPQYWKDFVTIFNSDKLKQRRGGLKSDVQEAEIANAAKNSQDKAQAVISYILKIGFTPTQIADSFAISMGGATLYRNRINTYKKQGLSLKEAETKAFEDFSKLSDEAQQSGDPALVSQQQRSVAGRLILSFQNTTMQYTRLMKKSGQDLINGRGDAKTHISKILYYGAIQNFLFNALSKTAFALIPGFEEEDEEDEDKKNQTIEKKAAGILDGMTDSVIRGTGIYGAIFTTLKNSISTWKREDEKGFTGDQTKTIIELANLAPAIGSKLRKVYSSIQTRQFDRDIIEKHPWAVTIDGKFNPSSTYTIIANLSSAAFNIPLDRALAEARSVGEMLDDRNSKFQRIALALGWRTWNVGAKNEEFDLIKLEGKAKRKIEGKEKAKKTRAAKKEKEKQRVANLSPAEKKKEIMEKEAARKKKALAKRRAKLTSRLTKNKK